MAHIKAELPFANNMSRNNLFKIIFILIIFLFFAKSQVYAVYCNAGAGQISGSVTITADCNYQYAVDGVDTGTGSTNTATITINSGIMTVGSFLGGQSIAFGSIIIGGTGSIVVDKTSGSAGVLKPGAAIYIAGADADGDHYSASTTADTFALTGTVRRNTMLSLAGGDCCDSDANVHPGAGASATASTCGTHTYNSLTYDAYDLNCNGSVAKSDGRAGSYSCTGATNPGCDPCNRSYQINSAPGWDTGNPGCGSGANWVSCSRAVGCWTAVVENCGDVCTGSWVTQTCN